MTAEVDSNHGAIARLSLDIDPSATVDYGQSLLILGAEQDDEISEAGRSLEYGFYRSDLAGFIIVTAVGGAPICETRELPSSLYVPSSRALLIPRGGLSGSAKVAVTGYLAAQRRQGEVTLQGLVMASANRVQVSYLHGGVQSNRWVDLPKTSEEIVRVAGELL